LSFFSFLNNCEWNNSMPESIRTRKLRQSARILSTSLSLLTATALVASWAAMMVVAETAGGLDNTVNFESRSPIYYVTHGLGLLSVLAAGALAISRGRLFLVRRISRIAFVALVVLAITWAVASYPVDELLSTAVFGSTGPFVWLTLIFVLAGTDRRVWRLNERVIQILAYVTAAVAAVNLLHSEDTVYVLGYTRNTVFCVMLMWLGGWSLLSAIELRGWRLLARATPVLLLFLTAIQSQARSWVLLAFMVSATFLILRGRQQGSLLLGVRNMVLAGALTVLVVFALSHTVFNGALEGIAQRLADDTRSTQYRDFFSVVPIRDLALGRGPTGTWYWYGVGDYQYFDNGFLWMLFIGGLPLFISYIIFVLWPAVGALQAKPKGSDAAAVWLVFLWGVALTGLSTYTLPSVAFTSYIVSLYAGRCHLIVAEHDFRLKQLAGKYRTVGAALVARHYGKNRVTNPA
jgi:hypothetical protein